MKKHLKNIIALVFVPALVMGCATPQPVPFQLIDSESRIQKGTIFPDRERIEVTIEGQSYKGFYLVANGVAHSETFGGSWRSLPRNTVTTYSSNSVRAQLISEKGQRLSCEFLFESNRAIGECRTPAGAIFQLVADGK
jgi:hypothetical protein